MFRRKHEHFLTTRLSQDLPLSESFKYKMSSCGAPLILCTLGTPNLHPPPQISTWHWQSKLEGELDQIFFLVPSISTLQLFSILLWTWERDQCWWHQKMTFIHQFLGGFTSRAYLRTAEETAVNIFILLTSYLPARSLRIYCVSLLKITAPSQHLSPLKYPLWVPVTPFLLAL